MNMLAMVRPINVITREQDGEAFELWYNHNDHSIRAIYDNGKEETLEYTAKTVDNAYDIIYNLYAIGNGWICNIVDVQKQ